MDGHPIDIEEKIAKAQRANGQLGILLDSYRGYLRLVASQHLRQAGLNSKLDESDIVQDVFWKVHQAFGCFKGSTEPELSAWLKAVLKNHVTDICRRFLGPERDLRLEKPIYNHEAADSAIVIFYEPSTKEKSPSQHAIRGEEALLLADVIDGLPTNQKRAICLRYFDGLSMREVSDEMKLSVAATAGLLKRGIARLRSNLPVRLRHQLNDAP